jgi:hypothetical protein
MYNYLIAGYKGLGYSPFAVYYIALLYYVVGSAQALNPATAS